MTLIRIVRMVFDPDFVPQFKKVFQESAPAIRAFEGCVKLQLWQDAKYPNVYYTHSHWHSEKELEAYRSSDLFQGVWQQTRKGFIDRPQAWSTYSLMDVKRKENIST